MLRTIPRDSSGMVVITLSREVVVSTVEIFILELPFLPDECVSTHQATFYLIKRKPCFVRAACIIACSATTLVLTYCLASCLASVALYAFHFSVRFTSIASSCVL